MFKKLSLLLFMLLLLRADIIINGYLHPGDNEDSYYDPVPEPLTYDKKHTYYYYINNPTVFYLSDDADITKAELIDAKGIDGKISIYIDGKFIAQGDSGSNVIEFDSALHLTRGYHSIAAVGECMQYDNGSCKDIDDYIFSSIKLYTSSVTTAYMNEERHHTGDDDDDDDDYDIYQTSKNAYPDSYEGVCIEYNVNNTDNLAGFEIYLDRIRDIYQDSLDKLYVYDGDGNEIVSFDLNKSGGYLNGLNTFYKGNVAGVSKIKVCSGELGGSYDDISFDDLVFIPIASDDEYDFIKKPILDYRMDECEWDDDTATFEIKNSGTLGSYADATAINGANTYTGGVIQRDGDFDTKYMELKNYPAVNGPWSASFWVKFPLVGSDNQVYLNINNDDYYAYVIASVDGRGDLGLFFKNDDGDYLFCVYDNRGSIKYIDIPDLSDGWHYFTMVSNGSSTTLYIDGDTDDPYTVNLATYGLLKYIGTSTDSSDDETIGAKMDEFKIFPYMLSAEEIKNIYDNEKNGKNWDGSVRSEVLCNSAAYKFDAWNDNLNIDDRNITTKIAGADFNLTIASLDNNGSALADFNGTVCVRIVSSNYTSDWQKIIFSNEKEKNETFNVLNALKDARVNMQWRLNEDVECPINDGNESNSTDNFAVRPDKFVITDITSGIKAGDEFNITVKAVDINGNPVKDYNESIYVNGDSVDLEYNETNPDCKTGVLSKVSGGEFIDGEANITLKYSEVGELNISLKETNSTEFAVVDNDDTDENDRFIKSTSQIINIGINHFEINASYYNYDTDNNFTYYDEDLNISSHLEVNISAVDKNGNILSNYNKECYAKDIDINISHNTVDVNVSKIIFRYIDKSGTAYEANISKDDNILFTYSKDNFTTDNNGSTTVEVYLNFDRNISDPVNPFEFNLTEIDVNDTDANGSEILGQTARYYYGTLFLDDILATQDDINKTYSFAVFSSDNKDLLPNGNELVVNWYLNTLHQSKDGNVSDSEIVVSQDYNSSDTVTGVNVSVGSIENGNMLIKIQRTDSKVNFAVIHLMSPELKWLWYSKYGNEYDVSSGSTCLNHFCFSVTWQKINENGEVGSGDFTGTEANVTDTNSTKRGIKIFR